MKRIVGLVAIVATVLAGCSGTASVKKEGSVSEKMAMGWVDRTFMDDTAYVQFKQRYDTVSVDAQAVDMFRQLDKGIDVTVVFGSWCSDSRREVPHFLKIADMAGMTFEHLKLLGVDRSKKSGKGDEEKFHIERVPTFIFFKNHQEIGRITESPRSTLEGDMLSILAGAQTK